MISTFLVWEQCFRWKSNRRI